MGFVVESSSLVFLLGMFAVDTMTLCLEVGENIVVSFHKVSPNHFSSSKRRCEQWDLFCSHFKTLFSIPSPTEFIKTNIEVIRSHASFQRKHFVQKSLLEFLVENNVLVDDIVAVERIFQAVGVKWSRWPGWKRHKSVSLRPVSVYLSKLQGNENSRLEKIFYLLMPFDECCSLPVHCRQNEAIYEVKRKRFVYERD